MRVRALLAATALAAASPALADYTFDPADLPAGFKCDTDSDAEPCDVQKRAEAWSNRYGDRYDRWYFGLTYDLDGYFYDEVIPVIDEASDEGWEPERNLGARTENLVDAVYMIALRRHGGWAFAVKLVCPPGEAQTDAQCAPKLRMVRPRKPQELSPQDLKIARTMLPTTREEVAAFLRLAVRWDEADLRSCEGALNQLLALPAQRGRQLWHPGYVGWLKGRVPKRPEEMIVTADGSGVYVRARSVSDPSALRPGLGAVDVVYSQWNGGEGMAWALDMAKVVQPCLKPATAPAPWDRPIKPDRAR